MLDSDILITKIDKIVLVDDKTHGRLRSDYCTYLPTNELYCSFSGNATVFLNDNKFQIKAGDVVFLSQGEHQKYTVIRNELSECIDIYFTTDKPVTEEEYKKFSIDKKIKIQSLFQKAFRVWVAKNDGYYYKCMGILYEILSLLQSDKYIPEKKYKLIAPAVEYIEKHFTDKGFKYSVLADMCSISYTYFKRIFIEKFGVTPTKYVTLMRINYACDLLGTGKYSVSEVAALVGIDDVYYFSKLFKSEKGVSPSRYK